MSAQTQAEHLAERCNCGQPRSAHEFDYAVDSGAHWGFCKPTGCEAFELAADHEHVFSAICFVCDQDNTLCAKPGCLTCIRCGDWAGEADESELMRETDRTNARRHYQRRTA